LSSFQKNWFQEFLLNSTQERLFKHFAIETSYHKYLKTPPHKKQRKLNLINPLTSTKKSHKKVKSDFSLVNGKLFSIFFIFSFFQRKFNYSNALEHNKEKWIEKRISRRMNKKLTWSVFWMRFFSCDLMIFLWQWL
jgi:hypothetical protein